MAVEGVLGGEGESDRTVVVKRRERGQGWTEERSEPYVARCCGGVVCAYVDSRMVVEEREIGEPRGAGLFDRWMFRVDESLEACSVI